MMRLPHTSDSGHTLLIRVLKQLITAKHNTRLKLPKARKQLVAFIGILLEVCTERVCVYGVPMYLITCRHYLQFEPPSNSMCIAPARFNLCEPLVRCILLPLLAKHHHHHHYATECLATVVPLLHRMIQCHPIAPQPDRTPNLWPARISYWALLEAMLRLLAHPIRDAGCVDTAHINNSNSSSLLGSTIDSAPTIRSIINSLVRFGMWCCTSLACQQPGASHSTTDLSLAMLPQSFRVFCTRIEPLGHCAYLMVHQLLVAFSAHITGQAAATVEPQPLTAVLDAVGHVDATTWLLGARHVFEACRTCPERSETLIVCRLET
jgi:hypothetical protein